MKELILSVSIFVATAFSDGQIKRTPVEITSSFPKNIIFLIGDGMGLSQISAAVLNQGKPTSFEMFPIIGFQKTYSSDNLVTDSAASATAMACGKKTYNLAVGVDVDTIPCTSILEEAEGKGLATGIIVTCSIV
ncbi:MAG: alkaline phosphatase, partial [Bacteroidota bacterium]